MQKRYKFRFFFHRGWYIGVQSNPICKFKEHQFSKDFGPVTFNIRLCSCRCLSTSNISKIEAKMLLMRGEEMSTSRWLIKCLSIKKCDGGEAKIES